MATSRRPNQEDDHEESPSRRCPRKWVPCVLVLVGFHLLAVVAEPLHFFSRSEVQSSPEFAALRRTFAPYVEWLYLDHGYFFFAPNPGPSHLVAAMLVPEAGQTWTSSFGASAGSLPETDTPNRVGISDRHLNPKNQLANGEIAYLFPDRTRQWPRLLYHRYFMLSEFYNNVFAPSELLPDDRQDLEFVARWEQDREFYALLQKSMTNSMAYRLSKPDPTMDRPQGPGVNLVRLERPLPTVEQILKQGLRLNDSRNLEVLPESPRIPSGESVQPQRLKFPSIPSGKP
ncbi:MAG: hypothetical protein FJ308_12100 [Planctomycetes bacterium]|nr:hypothetical protein [Planctomycetota bacterium]